MRRPAAGWPEGGSRHSSTDHAVPPTCNTDPGTPPLTAHLGSTGVHSLATGTLSQLYGSGVAAAAGAGRESGRTGGRASTSRGSDMAGCRHAAGWQPCTCKLQCCNYHCPSPNSTHMLDRSLPMSFSVSRPGATSSPGSPAADGAEHRTSACMALKGRQQPAGI